MSYLTNNKIIFGHFVLISYFSFGLLLTQHVLHLHIVHNIFPTMKTLSQYT